MTRRDGRAPADLRPVEIQTGYLRTCPGSVLYRCGGTSVIVSAHIAEDVPPWLVGKGTGWLTAEYAMLPGSTPTRKKRGPDGRATEIQRLIGRSLRAAVDLKSLGPITLSIDADVIEADGGTRTAAITGAYVAAVLALRKLFGSDASKLIKAPVAAVSAGIIDGVPMLDLDYSEDSRADVDLNVVRLGPDGFVEVQGTGEGGVFKQAELTAMLDLASAGIDRLMQIQSSVL
jgi:ribonuclease PH